MTLEIVDSKERIFWYNKVDKIMPYLRIKRTNLIPYYKGFLNVYLLPNN